MISWHFGKHSLISGESYAAPDANGLCLPPPLPLQWLLSTQFPPLPEGLISINHSVKPFPNDHENCSSCVCHPHPGLRRPAGPRQTEHNRNQHRPRWITQSHLERLTVTPYPATSVFKLFSALPSLLSWPNFSMYFCIFAAGKYFVIRSAGFSVPSTFSMRISPSSTFS